MKKEVVAPPSLPPSLPPSPPPSPPPSLPLARPHRNSSLADRTGTAALPPLSEGGGSPSLLLPRPTRCHSRCKGGRAGGREGRRGGECENFLFSRIVLGRQLFFLQMQKEVVHRFFFSSPGSTVRTAREGGRAGGRKGECERATLLLLSSGGGGSPWPPHTLPFEL